MGLWKLGLTSSMVVLVLDSAATVVWEVPAERDPCNCLKPRRRSSPSGGCGGCVKGMKLNECALK